jgi:NADH-quinone oxidoreductase subunit M
MNQYGFPFLSLIIFLPLVGAAVVAVLPSDQTHNIRRTALAFSLLTFVLSLGLYFGFDSATAQLQFVDRVDWVASLGIGYYVGLDGISLLLVLLTTLLSAIAILSTWTAITERVKEFMVSMLLLETALIGVFSAVDLFAFYVFWEASLIPMYFIIGIWGGPRRIYATMKFVLYTMAGSALMLIAILALVFQYYTAYGVWTFDLFRLQTLHLPVGTQMWLFLAFALAFAIKVPLFPFHTWLPDAHVEAPTAGSVILAGVLLKMGTYGFVRFGLPLFPDATRRFVPLIAVLAIIGIIYGAMVAFAQRDVKSLVAYSSVSHLGFVMLGLFALNPEGLSGGILQMVNHGLSTGALFLLVGMIYERRHTRLIADFGGLWRRLPVFSAFFLVVMLSSIGLPGLNGFVGEFLILVGAFLVNPWYAVLAATGVVLSAAYMLWMFQRVMFGPLDKEENQQLLDLNGREIAILVPIVALILLIGIYPQPFLGPMQVSVAHLLSGM